MVTITNLIFNSVPAEFSSWSFACSSIGIGQKTWPLESAVTFSTSSSQAILFNDYLMISWALYIQDQSFSFLFKQKLKNT